ncbi:exonuclease-like protein [Pseudovirgaria hyperparasitica]|uniref:Exonuclease-like protein n=1 Tax=Pseudovirgaria hyperparasitica TaxID=470096 RepID=A0A6A6WCE2_9PEZI|nr:exonuclease-like protein [Pseudovirgaria hyperparasitica]KAF2760383.1 exonuclease-like protein [Pseudovirgaria hyperparasitica]
MDGDWGEIAAIPLAAPTPHGQHATAFTSPQPTAIALDPYQELLWAGTDRGTVASFHIDNLRQYHAYTRFRAHRDIIRDQIKQVQSVRQILVFDKGVLSVSPKSVHLSNRRGVTQWHLEYDGFEDLHCMTFTSKAAQELVVAGQQDTMFVIDIEKGSIIQTMNAVAHYTRMKSTGQYICACTNFGNVHFLDTSKFQLKKEWEAHGGWVNDIDASGHLVITCGGSRRGLDGVPYYDSHANVFDMKAMKPLTPISCTLPVGFVRMHPRLHASAMIASHTGYIQLVDVNSSSATGMHQLPLFNEVYLQCFELSAAGESIAYTDTYGQLRLHGSASKFRISEYSNGKLEWYDQIPTQELSWDEPLNKIGVPVYRGPLLSNWPGHTIYEVGAPPPLIDETLLTQAVKSGGWTSNPDKSKPRNLAEKTRSSHRVVQAMAVPKFLSDRAKARTAPSMNSERRRSETFETIIDKDGQDGKEDSRIYQPMDIQYSRFGIEDYDFRYWNSTPYPGLETHVNNSYANSLLQLFRFVPWIRNAALWHAASSCLYETCLLCQLGYLIDMLEKTDAPNCHPSNFLKTMETLQEARAAGILIQASGNNHLASMVQALNGFLVKRFVLDAARIFTGASPLEQIFTLPMQETMRCSVCKVASANPSVSKTMVQELSYAQTTRRSPGRTLRNMTFSQILKLSVEGPTASRGWCSTCRRYQSINRLKNITDIPGVLLVNTKAGSGNEDSKSLWTIPNWLPQEIGVILQQGQFFCFEGNDIKTHLQRGAHDMQLYELIGVVCDVTPDKAPKQHLVSIINVSPSSAEKGLENKWYLFNDHHVRSIPVAKALRFDARSKLPVILAYQRKSYRHEVDDGWKENLDTSALFQSWSHRQEQDVKKFRLLDQHTEYPRKGMPIAIDAEFVEVRKEEIEITPEGTKQISRPQRLALARVSVLRGDGIDEGVPFIDDHVIVTEPITDYLTEWSGIHEGDLNPNISRHAPVPLKVIYKKLWLLLNLGCVFIGHGLIKDFRTINILIPPAQVFDTVKKFHDEETKRLIKLKFLAWHFFRTVDFQNDKELGHDSIEDAYMALRLWRKWREFEDAGITKRMIQELYIEGNKVGWRLQGQDSGRPGTSGGRREMSDFGLQTPERGNSRAQTPLTTPKTQTIGSRILGPGGSGRDVFADSPRKAGTSAE